MQIVTISDSHNFHRVQLLQTWLDDIENKENSMIIHAGDVSGRGSVQEVTDFLEWYDSLPFKYKILIAGNHDFLFESNPSLIINLLGNFSSVIYLEDTSVTIEGFKIHGSPVQPWFHNWAFNRQRGDDIIKHWEKIPKDTDILITHGPAYLKGDKVSRGGEHVGCEDLLRYIEEIKPMLHVSGHIHEGYGHYYNQHTEFVNASILNEDYQLVNPPMIFTLEK
jgi:Icc-related predicted phosphoesterase